ncbi:MAG: AP2 domain-containing protein [Verrucomicrobiales bacterium]|nr:AP2 domain-containing protein [Verrucomicrobiales bacterium]
MSSPRPNYGITRIDQPEKKNHGFYVRITHRGKSHQKYFPDKASGGKTKALKAAKEHRDKLLSKMPKYKQEAASKKKRRIKQSGVVGVTHVVSKSPKGKSYEYWQAAWASEDGKRKTAKFSITRYGTEKALTMAKKARRDGLKGKR